MKLQVKQIETVRRFSKGRQVMISKKQAVHLRRVARAAIRKQNAR